MDDFSEGLGQAADITKTGANLAKNLPGMTGQNKEAAAEAPEAKVCETCNQPIAICPTCHQKVVTSQPAGGVDVQKGLETAGSAFDCCSKAFDCFNSASGGGE